MKKLAMQGHATRGDEVMEILKMLGGENKYDIKSANEERYTYFIRDDNAIVGKYYPSTDDKVYNIDEFLKKYPYKIADEVTYIDSFGQKNTSTITSMFWDEDLETVMYETEENDIIYAHDIKNMKTEEKPTILDPVIRADMVDFARAEKDRIELFVGNEFEIIQEDGKWFAIRKQPKYPKTYEECCKVLNLTKYPPTLAPNKSMFISQYENFPHYYEIQKLAELLICRDAYWKIAGDWKPDWKKADERKYCIVNTEGNITNWVQKTTNKILAFPTEEMRDAFKENFDGDIDICKEFL